MVYEIGKLYQNRPDCNRPITKWENLATIRVCEGSELNRADLLNKLTAISPHEGFLSCLEVCRKYLLWVGASKVQHEPMWMHLQALDLYSCHCFISHRRLQWNVTTHIIRPGFYKTKLTAFNSTQWFIPIFGFPTTIPVSFRLRSYIDFIDRKNLVMLCF